MINVDDRLIRNDLKIIGVDAFAILMCITSHLGKSSTAWPGVPRLREMTGLSKARTYAAIKTLIDARMVERWQENDNGTWGMVIYRVTTNYLAIYMNAATFTLSEPLAGNAEHCYPEHGKPESGNTAHISINKEEVLSNKEVIKKEEERRAPEKTEPHPTEQQEKTPPPCSAPPPSPQVGARNAPTVERMTEYLEDLILDSKWQPRFTSNPPETASEIHDYYTANGWKVGRNPMKDWRAACRNWLKNNKVYGKSNNKANATPTPQVWDTDASRRAYIRVLQEEGIDIGPDFGL
ncbi:MAG: hypothetical protein KDD19_26480 [Phaeodactylibacter sp.]|nr:hypothetical protein [Phaeodactylibacter sp.]